MFAVGRSPILLARNRMAAERGIPVDAAKECAEDSGKKDVHKHESPAILNERNFQFRTCDHRAPRILGGVIQGKRTSLLTPQQSNRGTEQNARSAGAN